MSKLFFGDSHQSVICVGLTCTSRRFKKWCHIWRMMKKYVFLRTRTSMNHFYNAVENDLSQSRIPTVYYTVQLVFLRQKVIILTVINYIKYKCKMLNVLEDRLVYWSLFCTHLDIFISMESEKYIRWQGLTFTRRNMLECCFMINISKILAAKSLISSFVLFIYSTEWKKLWRKSFLYRINFHLTLKKNWHFTNIALSFWELGAA